METFLDYETVCRETPPGHVFVEVWRKSIEGKWQKWCVVHVTKKQRLCDPFFRAVSETRRAISLETFKA